MFDPKYCLPNFHEPSLFRKHVIMAVMLGIGHCSSVINPRLLRVLPLHSHSISKGWGHFGALSGREAAANCSDWVNCWRFPTHPLWLSFLFIGTEKQVHSHYLCPCCLDAKVPASIISAFPHQADLQKALSISPSHHLHWPCQMQTPVPPHLFRTLLWLQHLCCEGPLSACRMASHWAWAHSQCSG